MYQQILNWVSEIIKENSALIGLASSRRSKFEGWLKFELARKLYQNSATEIYFEAPYGNGSKCDLFFLLKDEKYFVELKTPNTNYRINGIANLVRPVTLNRKSIIKDVYKLRENHITNGIICFANFPIPLNDDCWKDYINTISQKIHQPIDLAKSCRTQHIDFNTLEFNVVICCFRVI
jgi:hypothetical protein